MAVKIEEILWSDLGINDASEEDKAVILNRLAETVQNRVALRMGELLTASELDTFDLTIERQGAEEGMKYIEAVYPNYQLVVMEEVERLRAELTQDLAEVMHRAKQDDEESK